MLLSDCQSDLFNPNSIRSSLGAVFTVPAATDSAENIRSFLLHNAIRPIAARVQSSTDLWQADLSTPLAIVLGNEADGLDDRWLTLTDDSGTGQAIDGVRIPMSGQVDSLNISVSAAVLAFEASRRRTSS